MLSKVLISCALFVAVHALPSYGSGAQLGGYAAHGPTSVHILPGSYGYSAGGYGGIGGRISAPVAAAALAQPTVDGLTNLGLNLRSPVLPVADTVNVPQHAISSMSAPAVNILPGPAYGGLVSASNAALASSIVGSSRSGGYGPAQAISYGGDGSAY